ncbi:hypothetical protein Tco_0567681 [Tanacetum coccineum]
MAPMAFSDSEVCTDKTCSKTYLQNYETLKKQYDDLIVKLNQTEFTIVTYKRGLATVEAQLITYRKNEQDKDGIEFKIENFDKASKDLDQLLGSQITDKSKKGLGNNAVPPHHPLIYNRPNKLDLSYSGLDEFKKPEFKGYGLENREQEFNDRNWNGQKFNHLGKDFVMHNKACYVCGSFDHLQYTCKQNRQLNGQREEKPVRNNARRVNHQNSLRITHPNPKRHMVPRKILTRSGPISLNTARQSHFNAVRTNQVNAVKASACWVLRPIKPNSASITLKRYYYVDVRGRSRSVMAWVPKKV